MTEESNGKPEGEANDGPKSNLERIIASVDAAKDKAAQLQDSLRPPKGLADLIAADTVARTNIAKLMGSITPKLSALDVMPKIPVPEPIMSRGIEHWRSPEVVWLEAVVDATNANTEVTEAQTEVLRLQEQRLDGLHDSLQGILSEQRTTTKVAWATLGVAIVAAVLVLIGLLVAA